MKTIVENNSQTTTPHKGMAINATELRQQRVICNMANYIKVPAEPIKPGVVWQEAYFANMETIQDLRSFSPLRVNTIISTNYLLCLNRWVNAFNELERNSY